MTRLLRYIQKVRKWATCKYRRQETEVDVMALVRQEVLNNSATTLVVHKYARQVRSRVIFIPLRDGGTVMVRRVGRSCQVKKGVIEFDIDLKEFNGFWMTCIDKNYKYILK
jgi:hypothetical protein